MVLLSIPAFAVSSIRPKLNADPESLLVKDHDSLKFSAAVDTIAQYDRAFWSTKTDDLKKQQFAQAHGEAVPEADSLDRRRLLGADDASAQQTTLPALPTLPATLQEAARRRLRELRDAERASSEAARVLPTLAELRRAPLGALRGAGRRLAQTVSQRGAGKPPRQQQTRMLNIFYRYADNSTAITEELVKFVRPRPAAACRASMTPAVLHGDGHLRQTVI
jgi:hypothetical protein